MTEQKENTIRPINPATAIEIAKNHAEYTECVPEDLKKEVEGAYNEIKNMIIEFSDSIKELSEAEAAEKKNTFYEEVHSALEAFKDCINEIQYDFILTYSEKNVIEKYLLKEIKLTSDDNGLLLMERLYNIWLNALEVPFSKGQTSRNYPITMTGSVLLHTFMKTYELNGWLNKHTKDILSLLKKIGGIAHNYYIFARYVNNLNTQIQDVFAGFNPTMLDMQKVKEEAEKELNG